MTGLAKAKVVAAHASSATHAGKHLRKQVVLVEAAVSVAVASVVELINVLQKKERRRRNMHSVSKKKTKKTLFFHRHAMH